MIGHKLIRNIQKGEKIIATSSSMVIIPETRQMNLNMGRYSAFWGRSFISTYAMPWTIVAMTKGKMIAKCVSSGKTSKAWKCKPIKAIRNEARKTRSPWNASKKTSASSLAHTQTRNPSTLTLFLYLPNIRKKKRKRNPFSFIRFLS